MLPMETSSVRDQLLQHARSLLMTRGYHGFSYHDLARLVGVKTSSIHYYFPKKEDLVLEAINAYSKEVLAEVRDIDPSLPAEKKLERYAMLFGQILGDGDRICLCGMLAADLESLPDNLRKALQGFFKANETWLAKVLSEGVASGSLRVNGKAESAARALYAAFQGSLLSARLFRSKARLEDVVGSVRAS
jgi:TetR/AcrR family transcriptional regulator, transcriptional repressor for nem operon